MRYEVVQSREDATTWVAGAVDDEGEGEMYMVIFEGPHARERADEYAVWKNAAERPHLGMGRRAAASTSAVVGR